DRLLKYASKHKIKAYASVGLTRDELAVAIDNSKSGVLTRYNLGEEWFTDSKGNVTWDKNAIEPLRLPKSIISGHAVTDSNYDGNSFRIANSWGWEWADNGTAYRLHAHYRPSEAWQIWYGDEELPDEITEQQKKLMGLQGEVIKLLQQLLEILQANK